MKILQVIHGYPMRYNAGSEVYTQGIASALADRHEVHVFSRKEDPFQPSFLMSHEPDPSDHRVRLHLVNHPHSRDRYRHAEIDEAFAKVLRQVQPDIIHIGHLNHLSTSLVEVASVFQIPVVYTLHDYWLCCPRGQFVQMMPMDKDDPWGLCDEQEDRKCATCCYSRYFSGDNEDHSRDVEYWTDWVARRMAHVRELVEQIDHFITPSRFLGEIFKKAMSVPAKKITHLDYGFHIDRLEGRTREAEEGFVFGYIGTHTPPKGIQHLLEAFSRLEGSCRLRIFGRDRGMLTAALTEISSHFPMDVRERIEWLPEYQNDQIISDVMNRVDAIVTPSIWLENSPLVIHEALHARVPVITADAGGMKELVQHQVNGLLFEHRNLESLAEQMQRFVVNPSWAMELGRRGYLADPAGNVTSMAEHIEKLEQLYLRTIRSRKPDYEAMRPGPWRITFDTNPDDCNLSCIMCEEHSMHSPLQELRRRAGKPPRRMPIETIRRVMEERKGTPLREIIPSTMGEPLIYKDFEEIIDLCHEYGVQMNLTTNGTFPRKTASEWAKLIVPVTSDVKISWNGANRETQEAIMLGSRWEKVLQNLEDFIAVRDDHANQGGNRCRVTLQLTFLETNVRELPDIVRLAINYGVDRVKGHHLWAHFKEIKDLSMRRNPEAIERWNQAVREAMGVAENNPLPNGKIILLENIYELDPSAQEELSPHAPCPFLGKEAWVSAEGRFNPCCAPDAERRTLGEFGNLEEASIGEIWSSAPYQKLRKSYLQQDLCRQCNMRQKEAW